jgi:hypothetical protein
MKIDIITHCWRYSRCLAYQLSSLELCRPQASVRVVVVTTPDDQETNRLIDYYQQLAGWDGPELCVTRMLQPLRSVLQRAIGRNNVARETSADVVWFADADHCFGPGCIDAIGLLPPGVFYWPGTVLRHRSHAIGDEYIRSVSGPGIYWIRDSDFEPVKMARGIGGIQIVDGSTARSIGYCGESRWQRPLPEGATKFEFGSDVAYRRKFDTKIALNLPNLYRIRQTTSGEVDSL